VTALSACHGNREVLRNVGLVPEPAGCLAVVGPSGSGKSTLARCLVGLHRGRVLGELTLDGIPLRPDVRRRSVEQRRAVQLVAQDSAGALNPRETVAEALARPVRAIRPGRRTGPLRPPWPYPDPDGVRSEVELLLRRVGLPAGHADRYPAMLSGGERQRVNLARALACTPQVLVCDEVTSALDAETSNTIMRLLAGLRSSLGLTVVLVTHDLAAVAAWADQVVVLDGGAVVEEGDAPALLSCPRHPVTRALVAAASG
jgi:ABC-type glutathione transport system ATPase component